MRQGSTREFETGIKGRGQIKNLREKRRQNRDQKGVGKQDRSKTK